MSVVDVVIDLRNLTVLHMNPEQFLAHWSLMEHQLVQTPLRRDTVVPVALEGLGTVRIEILNVGAADGHPHRFAVRGLIEPPRPWRACTACAVSDTTRAGAFECADCARAGKPSAVCGEHVVVLDGAYHRKSLRIACPVHAPTCTACDRHATFWCHGPGCRNGRPWCQVHRKAHRNSPAIGYCATCFDLEFPQCRIEGCSEPGVNTCEHIDPAGDTACGLRLCNRHVTRWQVYGYERIGLGRCQHHRNIKALTDVAVVFQVVAGTAWREIHPSRGADRYFLPTLGSVKNILIKGRNQRYDELAASRLYQQLLDSLGKSPSAGPLRQAMRRSLERAAQSWGKRVLEAESRRNQGVGYFEALKGALARRGESALASAVTFSDFVQTTDKAGVTTHRLFVSVPAEWKGRFIGKGGSTIRALEALVGCKISPEREGQQ